ncbi:nickel transporter [Accumulibacter sp.]|uniref:HoxN/HupN/NixA family nickel/cobalt transporter n=1 Tax=Accumulibacter sp. TaxID=2053492 RepID=UPI00260A8D77|nr:nickel transporter [Accumulibacter sp.]
MLGMPSDWTALLLLVFVLGIKHGFDADHLATIDGLTRFNARANPPLARRCGMLFSLGHGAVVVVIALAASTLIRQWQVPAWLEVTGAWISIGVLTLLGLVNLRALSTTRPDQMVALVGVKSRWLGRLARSSKPGWIMFIGALFAFSFDTLSQAALFALTANQFGGWQHALALGLLFTLGMLVTDGINGLWIARLIARADQMALVASRLLSFVISSLSLLIAAVGVASLAFPEVNTWSEGRELLFGAALISCVAGSYLLALYLSSVHERVRTPIATPTGDLPISRERSLD